MDPKAEKYPNLSPYSAFGLNPIYYIDPGGETLKVAMNEYKKTAIRDLRSILPEGTRSALRVLRDGTVRLRMTKKVREQIDKDPGLIVINGIVSSTDKTVLYEVSDRTEVYDIADRNSKLEPIKRGKRYSVYLYDTPTDHGVVNATENYPLEGQKTFKGLRGEVKTIGDMPKDGYNGQVTLPPSGSWIELDENDNEVAKPRAASVFHELGENYLQTILGFKYDKAHDMISEWEKDLPSDDTRRSHHPGEIIEFRSPAQGAK